MMVAGLVTLTVTFRILHIPQVPGIVMLRNGLLLVTTWQALTTLGAVRTPEKRSQ